MAQAPITVGIIGVGIIGKTHLEKYAAIPDVKVIAIADIDEPELHRVAELHAVPHAYTDFRALLRRDDIQAVDVCLHNNLHAPVTIEALRTGKHVYCEKPMAGSYADARAMLAEARRLGLKLSIQLSTLFSKETKAARRIIDSGLLGRIYHARSAGHRRRGRPFVDGYATDNFVKKEIAGGGALYDVGVYHISQVLFLLGQPRVERISGRIYQETSMDAGRRRSSGYNVEEFALGLVHLAQGLTLDVIESWAVNLSPFECSYIAGSEGGLRLNPLTLHSRVADIDADTGFDLDSSDWRRHQLDAAENAYDSAQGHWVSALLDRVPLLPTAEIALQSMLVSEGIYLSDRLGREVTGAEVESLSQSTAIAV